MRVQSSCQLRLQSSGSFTGAKGSIPKMAHLHDYWLEASVYCRLLTCSLHTYINGPLTQLFKHSHQVAGSCPQSRTLKKKKKQGGSLSAFVTNYWKLYSITSTLFNLLNVSH